MPRKGGGGGEIAFAGLGKVQEEGGAVGMHGNAAIGRPTLRSASTDNLNGTGGVGGNARSVLPFE